MYERHRAKQYQRQPIPTLGDSFTSWWVALGGKYNRWYGYWVRFPFPPSNAYQLTGTMDKISYTIKWSALLLAFVMWSIYDVHESREFEGLLAGFMMAFAAYKLLFDR